MSPAHSIGSHACLQHTVQGSTHGLSKTCRVFAVCKAYTVRKLPLRRLLQLASRLELSCRAVQPSDQHTGVQRCPQLLCAPVVAGCQLAELCCGLGLLCCCHAEGSTQASRPARPSFFWLHAPATVDSTVGHCDIGTLGCHQHSSTVPKVQGAYVF